MKKNLKGLSIEELQEFVRSLDEPSFRGNQLYHWLYSRGASTFGQMSSLSRSFRARLDEVATIDTIQLLDSRRSELDGTTKLLFELGDGGRIESVLIPSEPADGGGRPARGRTRRRLTLCVSTQVGCPLDCAFCATGAMGYMRNLSTGEIIDQVHQGQRLSRAAITNIVYMGMGEPMMNYENVMKSAMILTHGLRIAAQRITVSTAGWADHIRRMGEEQRKIKLAVSLHSLDNHVRSLLMPVNRKYPLKELIHAIEYYYRKTKRRVTYEYILFDGLNDTDEDVVRIISLAKRVPCKVNIVPFHSIEFARPDGFPASLRPTPGSRVEQVIRSLREAHVTVMVRSSAGEDIDAACGQLAVLAGKIPTPAGGAATPVEFA